MGGCCQKQVRVDNSKSAIVPSWASSPVYGDEPKVKLVGDVTCPHTQRIRIALIHKDVPVEASLVMPEDLRTCRDATVSPDGQFPVFQHGDHKITGSVDAILAYIEENFENPPLLPSGLEKEVTQWVSYIRETFTSAIEEALQNGDPYAQEGLEAKLEESLSRLDAGFQSKGRYFMGSKFTLVDVYLIPFLSQMDLVTYIRGFTLNPAYTRLAAYKSVMCTFKGYKPVQVGTDLAKSVVVKSALEKPPQPLVTLALLQHKSIRWHLEAFVKVVQEFDGINRRPAIDTMQRTVFGTRLKELPKAYDRLLELLLEHAQMEERVIFPALETADQALTESARKDHARDLPVMNGVREDIKGVMGLRQGNFDHKEALSALTSRVEALEIHVKEHFLEEEKEQLPLLQAAGYGSKKQQAMTNQALQVMEATHSRLFPYLLEGLPAHEVHQYLGLMQGCTSEAEFKASVLPRLANALNSNAEEYERVRKVAVERMPALAAPQYFTPKGQSRPSSDQAEDTWHTKKALTFYT